MVNREKNFINQQKRHIRNIFEQKKSFEEPFFLRDKNDVITMDDEQINKDILSNPHNDFLKYKKVSRNDIAQFDERNKNKNTKKSRLSWLTLFKNYLDEIQETALRNEYIN